MPTASSRLWKAPENNRLPYRLCKRKGWEASQPFLLRYSPKCLEEKFSEVHIQHPA
jgi:hypothetical protein